MSGSLKHARENSCDVFPHLCFMYLCFIFVLRVVCLFRPLLKNLFFFSYFDKIHKKCMRLLRIYVRKSASGYTSRLSFHALF